MKTVKLAFAFGLLFLLMGCGGAADKINFMSDSTSIASSSIENSSVINSSVENKSSSSARNTSRSSNSSHSSSRSSSKPLLISYGQNKMQIGELRLPENLNGQLVPLVVIIHGGCWVSSYADYHLMDSLAQSITNLGYATWNIEYRALGTDGNWPVIFQDVGEAIDYVRTLTQSYPINGNKIGVIGHSAGGHLALWAAGRKNIKSDSALYRENPLLIRGVISLAGIADVTSMNACYYETDGVIGLPFMPMNNTLTQRLQETSPQQMLPIKTKTILISGSIDSIVPAVIGKEYSDKAAELGDNSVHYILPGLGHFDLIYANKTDWTLYQQSLAEVFKD